jgi:ADP-ribosylglycohydrolase
MQMKNIWKEGIFGVVVGDALGCPVQFESREKVARHPVTGMRGQGTFNLPAGSWTDDSSLTLALLDSIGRTGKMDLKDIMGNFVEWLEHGAFTPYGYSYDIGFGTEQAIQSYMKSGNPFTCGGTASSNNGNGSLMRIMPACLYCYAKGMDDEGAIRAIHAVGSLTHAHIRANIACGLYFFMIRSVLDGEGSLQERMQEGLDRGFAYYEKTLQDPTELKYYDRIRDLAAFAQVPAEEIRGSGYVVETLEAVVWALVTTSSFEEALLKVVNLGQDTDTTGAIAGGLSALYYGYDAIPAEWIDAIQKKEWIGELCEKAEQAVQ